MCFSCISHSHVQSGTILLDTDITAESVDQVQDGMVKLPPSLGAVLVHQHRHSRRLGGGCR